MRIPSVAGRRPSGPVLFRLLVWSMTLLIVPMTLLVVPMAMLEQAHAQAEASDQQLERAQHLSRTIMSPFCPGRTLDSCPSPNATRWREDIRDMVAQGMSNEQIRQALKQRTDQDLTGAPSTALDSVLPVIVAVLALLLLVLLLRALVSRKGPASPERASSAATDATAPPPPQPGASTADERGASARRLDERLDQELAELDD